MTPTYLPRAAFTGGWNPLHIPAATVSRIKPSFSMFLPPVLEVCGEDDACIAHMNTLCNNEGRCAGGLIKGIFILSDLKYSYAARDLIR